MSEARQAFRIVLKAVDKYITTLSGNTLWRDHIKQEFRRHRAETSTEKIRHRTQLAKDYAFLLTSVHEHKDLLLSYNIGIDREVGQKTMMARTAELVGLRLPVIPDEEVSEPPKSKG